MQEAVTGVSKGVTLVVMSEEKIDAILEKAKPIIESYQRHELALIREKISPDLKAGDGCCNCVLC